MNTLENLTSEQLSKQLSEPFSLATVKFRAGATNKEQNNDVVTKALALAYLEARDIQDRLDEVVGLLNWVDSYKVIREGQWGVEVECTLTIHGVSKTDVGIGGDAKAAYSDALKRAAVKFGIGRYLYKLPKKWVDAKQIGRNVKLLETPNFPYWALPNNIKAEPEPEPEPELEPEPEIKLKVRAVAQNKMLHALGRKCYGNAWDTKRPALCLSASKGRTNSSALLTIKECDKLIEGIEKKVAVLFPN